jgi:hypothetical protein
MINMGVRVLNIRILNIKCEHTFKMQSHLMLS